LIGVRTLYSSVTPQTPDALRPSGLEPAPAAGAGSISVAGRPAPAGAQRTSPAPSGLLHASRKTCYTESGPGTKKPPFGGLSPDAGGGTRTPDTRIMIPLCCWAPGGKACKSRTSGDSIILRNTPVGGHSGVTRGKSVVIFDVPELDLDAPSGRLKHPSPASGPSRP
jgi:hypothetical protein